MPTATLTPTNVVVHPLVLLSVVDHYNRVAKNTKKRVVGVLLGRWNGSTVDASNSFAVPFEEDERDPNIWYLDHEYLQSMADMFRKINAKELIIGWYHSGPKLRPADLEINELIKRYNPNPILVIVDVQPKELGLPTDAYFAVEEIHDDGTATTKTFNHIGSEIGAEEAEEIGVEHFLRDVKDNAIGTLSNRVSGQLSSLRGLSQRLLDIKDYLQRVVDGTLPINHQIIYNLQDIFNLLPNLNVENTIKSFSVKTNDQLLLIYLSSLIRAVIALHNLINNKLQNRDAELKEHAKVNADDAQKTESKADKEKDKKPDDVSKSAKATGDAKK